MVKETIQQDVETNSDTSQEWDEPFDPTLAFTRNLLGDDKSTRDERKPNAEDQDTDQEQQEDDDTEDADPSDTEDSSEDPESKDETAKDPRVASDDDKVTIKVGDDEHQVSVKDLKRLFGQEAALTRKQQEAAEFRKKVDTEATRYTEGLTKMADVAKARWAEYEGIDYASARASMAPEQFNRLREDATKAYQEFKFFSEELTEVVETKQREHIQSMREAAKTCVTTLQRPPSDDAPNHSYIDGWNDTVYTEVRDFALSIGGDPQVINTIVDPVSIKIIHMAMLYKKAQDRAKTLKPTQKVPTSPKKVPVNTERQDMPSSKDNAVQRAHQRLARSGSLDDAAAVFSARMGVRK